MTQFAAQYCGGGRIRGKSRCLRRLCKDEESSIMSLTVCVGGCVCVCTAIENDYLLTSRTCVCVLVCGDSSVPDIG
jgi:hypothetical protein